MPLTWLQFLQVVDLERYLGAEAIQKESVEPSHDDQSQTIQEMRTENARLVDELGKLQNRKTKGPKDPIALSFDIQL